MKFNFVYVRVTSNKFNLLEILKKEREIRKSFHQRIKKTKKERLSYLIDIYIQLASEHKDT